MSGIAQTVTNVNPSAQTVTTESGDSVKYDYLVLAPGAMPNRLPIEGASLEGVHTLRGIQDAQKIVDGERGQRERVESDRPLS